MVGNPCLPSVVPMNESVRLWMKLDSHIHGVPFFVLTQQFFITRQQLETSKLGKREPRTQLSIDISVIKQRCLTAKTKSANILCPSIS